MSFASHVSGTHQEMEEISSRFSKEAGSEEIFIPENECDYPDIGDARHPTITGGGSDDDDYSPIRPQTKKPSQCTTIDLLTETLASGE